MIEYYDAVIVGSSFSSSFFLLKLLEKLGPNSRILVLERGKIDSHEWQIQHLKNSSFQEDSLYVNHTPRKPWVTHIGFGGNSNCWWGCTPRMMPADFQLNKRYGVGIDWPIQYDDLEPYYSEAEQIMAVSGSQYLTPFPKQQPYPQPPHKLTKPDQLLKSVFNQHFFPQPTARARQATGNRSACCATGNCHLCPIDAKFTIQNELAYLYEDPRVTLSLQTPAKWINFENNTATSVVYFKNKRNIEAKADLIVLGANALFNPYILLNSGDHHPSLGKYLNEQVSLNVSVDLDGVDNFQGSTSITGHGYMIYDGPHRKSHAAALIETFNIPHLRTEKGKWRHRQILKFIFEDLPSEKNFVSLDHEHPEKLAIHYHGHSDYTQKAIDNLPKVLEKILSPMPIEGYQILPLNKTEAHIQGTTRMGTDPKQSLVDKYLRHHKYQNLYVLGSGVFPSCPPANPTLTISALSLWAANSL